MAGPTPSETMPCCAVLERLEAAVDGELSDAEATPIEAHLRWCSSCAAEHSLALAIKSELRTLPSLDAPSEIIASVLQQADSARSAPRHRTTPRQAPQQRTTPRQAPQERTTPRQAPQQRPSFSQQGPRRTSRFSGRYLTLAAALLLALASSVLWLRPIPDDDAIRETAGIAETATITQTAADSVEVARATEEARYALAYIKQVHRRAGLKIRQDLLIERLVQPAVRSLSLPSRLGNSHDEDSAGRPDRS